MSKERLARQVLLATPTENSAKNQVMKLHFRYCLVYSLGMELAKLSKIADNCDVFRKSGYGNELVSQCRNVLANI